MRVAALVGNGLSIAYNPELAIPCLTRSLVDVFQTSGPVLEAVAGDPRVLADNGFEVLLGPFDRAASLLHSLPGTVSRGSVDAAFRKVLGAAETLQEVYREGMAVTLDLIASLAHGIPERFVVVHAFCEAIADLAEPDAIAIATLSYDGLLHAGFLQESVDLQRGNSRTLQISDLADGRTRTSCGEDFSDGEPLESCELRVVPDFGPGCARLINLHGSLGWLRRRSPVGVDARKFKIEDLRRVSFWEKYRAGKTQWEPLVVLTDVKDPVPQTFPFSLAYGAFFDELRHADRWLIAGYGFGDAPVNEMLRLAARARDAMGQGLSILAVGVGPPEDLYARVTGITGVARSAVVASGEGLPAACRSPVWDQWARYAT